MPFDELRRRALEALDGRRQAYHSAVATAVDEVRALLDAQRSPRNGTGERTASELGLFATGRIDPARFEALFVARGALDADALDTIETALATLTGTMAMGDELHTVRLPAGADLRDAVSTALARAGKVFGAGRAVENARTGVPPADYLDGFPARRWNRAERGIAPPLVVELEGADLRPAGLADFLDERQAMVLLVRKPAPPAAMARLIVPGTLVVQGASADALDALADWDGPAIVAVMPEAQAAFAYRPDQDGPGTLTVDRLPQDGLRPVGSLSVARQEADLGLLRLLDAAGAGAGRVVPVGGGGAVDDTDPADRLAAWLLRQAVIPEPGEA